MLQQLIEAGADITQPRHVLHSTPSLRDTEATMTAGKPRYSSGAQITAKNVSERRLCRALWPWLIGTYGVRVGL